VKLVAFTRVLTLPSLAIGSVTVALGSRMTPYDEWGTPLDLFLELHSEFDFTLDAAASSWNALLPRYNCEPFPARFSWVNQRVFCNPPYSDPMPFVSAARDRVAETSVLLLPLWGRQPWLGLALEWCCEYRPLGRLAFRPVDPTVRVRLSDWSAGLFVFRS